MVTNFLKLCSQGSANGVAFPLGASGVNCATGVNCAAGRVYIGYWEDAAASGLSLGLVVALGSKFLGID